MDTHVMCRFPHHTPGAVAHYTHCRCRCRECKAGSAARRRRVRRLEAYGRWNPWSPSLGSQRRIEALMCLGYSFDGLAKRAGTSQWTLRVAWGNGQISRGLAARVAAVYEDLWDKPRVGLTASERQVVSRCRNYAAAHGFLPPLAWDDIDDPNEIPSVTVAPSNRKDADPVMVDRAVHNVMAGLAAPDRLTLAEKKAALQRLVWNTDVSNGDIVRLLRVALRSVHEVRGERKAAA